MLTAEQIWQTERGGLLNYLRRRVGQADVAEDLLQEVFVKVHARLVTLKNLASARAWIYRIARHTVIDYYRTQKPNDPLPAELEVRAAEPSRAEIFLQGAERWLPRMIECLPDDYREAVRLADLQEIPLTEVARWQGLSLSGAKSRVQRGRAKLKALLFEYCEFEFDSRGQPIGYVPKPKCRCC